MPNRFLDWLRQAQRDYEKAVFDCDHGFYKWCCFTPQEVGEKEVKFLYYRMNQPVREHSLVQMLEG